MKILTVCGTRPELIRLSIIIQKLDKLVNHVFVYTNQNYDHTLGLQFFEELKIRKPDYIFDPVLTTFGEFIGNALIEFEKIIIDEMPDKILILGDTNSGLVSIIANRYKIPIFHMESGNRCYDSRVPEETNRRLIDHLSTYNLPYTENSKQNLLNEGFHKNNVFKTGNPIYEVLGFWTPQINQSKIKEKLNIVGKPYTLVTIHRAENVDNRHNLSNIVKFINTIVNKLMITIVSLHPRTKDKLSKYDLTFRNKDLILSEPFGFFDFVNLEKGASIIISDSGTVTEEACLFNVPSLIIRETTERQELIECGSTILTGTKYENMIEAYKGLIKLKNFDWKIPEDYLVKNVSDIVISILLGRN